MTRRLPLLLALCALVAGCGGDGAGDGGAHSAGAPEPTAAAASIRVTSPVIAEGRPIPSAYTCRGAGASPELHWSGVPAEARALALVVDDPDAPHGTYVHWVVVDIPPSDAGVAAGRVPDGATEVAASGGPGWSPPCPPSGTHHYRFHVYALRRPLHLRDGTTTGDALSAIASSTISWGLLTATASGG